MLFSSNPSHLLYISRSAIKLYDKTSVISEGSITTDMMEYLEVLDAEKLSIAIVNVLSKAAVQNQTLVALLDDDVVFREATPLAAQIDPRTVQDALINKIPFAAKDRSVLLMGTEDKLIVFGANKSFIQAVGQAGTTTRNKLTAIAPASAYGLRSNVLLKPETIGQILHNKAHVERVNFLTTLEEAGS